MGGGDFLMLFFLNDYYFFYYCPVNNCSAFSKAFDCKGTKKNKMGLKNNSFVRNLS